MTPDKRSEARGWQLVVHQPRVVAGAIGGLIILYGLYLAWSPHSATAVIAVGGLILFLALLLPADWKSVEVKLFGAEARIEREVAARATQAVQAALSDAPPEVIEELALPAEAVEAAPEASAAPEALTDARNRLAEWMTTQRTIPETTPIASGYQVGLTRLLRTNEPTELVVCTVRGPDNSLYSTVPDVSLVPSHLQYPTAPGFFWARYTATFPADFPIRAGTRLEPGSYRAVWGTAPRGRAGARAISSTQFELTEPIDIKA